MLRHFIRRFAAWLILITINDDDEITHEITIDNNDDGDPNHIHVTPINDCPCGPEVQPVEQEDGSISWLYLHNALDGRDVEADGQGVPLENPHGLLDEFDGLD